MAAERLTTDTDREPGADLPNVPLLEESLDYEKVEQKPTWRGWIHAATAPIALLAGVLLVLAADGAAAKSSSAVFATTSLLMFGTSAVYHRFNWSPKVRRTLKRLDHANIFLLIAGTYTPISVLSLQLDRAVLLLSLVWSGALLGIGFRVFWINAPRWLYVPLYLLLGWAAVMFMPDFFAADPAMMLLVIVGGLLYTVGAVIYGLKRPNPVPGHFGFHEIFHTLTVLAFLCHWTGILLVAVDPPLLA